MRIVERWPGRCAMCPASGLDALDDGADQRSGAGLAVGPAERGDGRGEAVIAHVDHLALLGDERPRLAWPTPRRDLDHPGTAEARGLVPGHAAHEDLAPRPLAVRAPAADIRGDEEAA